MDHGHHLTAGSTTWPPAAEITGGIMPLEPDELLLDSWITW